MGYCRDCAETVYKGNRFCAESYYECDHDNDDVCDEMDWTTTSTPIHDLWSEDVEFKVSSGFSVDIIDTMNVSVSEDEMEEEDENERLLYTDNYYGN